MPTIYLMRHGHVDNPDAIFNHETVPLSARGREQVEEAIAWFHSFGCPLRTVASPFLRTQQTAELVTSSCGMSYETDPRLEEWRVGPYLGKPLAEFYAATHYDQDPPPLVLPPEIEPLEMMAERVIEVIRGTINEVVPTMIVSHREPMVTAILRLQGKDFASVHHVDFQMGMVWKLTFDGQGAFQSAEQVFAPS